VRIKFQIKVVIVQGDPSSWFTPTYVTQPLRSLLVRKDILLFSLTTIQGRLQFTFWRKNHKHLKCSKKSKW